MASIIDSFIHELDFTITLTCVTDDDNTFVSWTKDQRKIADIKDNCAFTSIPDDTYNYACDVANTIYYLIIPPDAITGLPDSM
jgi:hypothetical protein